MPTAAVVVAHPDDETLWCGGFVLLRPNWDWFILTLCRARDRDRSAKFLRVLDYLGAHGTMGDLDDGEAQHPLDPDAVRHVIREGLRQRTYDFILTHGPNGEYTHHRRHVECHHAVTSLWSENQLSTDRLMLFSYDDLNGTRLPQARTTADELHQLDRGTVAQKHHIMTDLYGFDEHSWEARTTPAVEGFACASAPDRLQQLLATQFPDTSADR